MIKIDEPNENNVLTITASEKLSKEDYERMLPELEAILEDRDRLRFYIRLEDYSGFEMGALWEDVKFDNRYRNQFGKTAIVGHKKWGEWGTKFSALFFQPEMKYFDKAQSDEALRWINDE